MEELVYLNGTLLPRSQARISPFDHGYLYGYGLYETMRTYSGHFFRLERHLARLARGVDMLGLSSGVAQYDLEKAVCAVLEANGLKEARVRLTVSAGEGDMTPDPRTCVGPTVVAMAKDLVPQPVEVYQRGFRVVISSIRQNSQSPLAQIKSANNLNNILAKAEARVAGVDDALFLNERGFLAEASSSNVFIVSGGILATPSLDSGALEGITRQVVLELAASLGIPAREDDAATVDALLQSDEAFLSNSIIEIMPISEVDGQPVGKGIPGPMTKRLVAAYKDVVAKETASRKSH